METSNPTSSPALGTSPSGPLRDIFSNALRFWEPRRILYNVALAAVTAFWVVVTWPHFRPALTWSSLLPMAFLALLANVCYCAAYLVDIPIQCSAAVLFWKRWRWGLWVLGTLLAILLASYWINDEIYPDFH